MAKSNREVEGEESKGTREAKKRIRREMGYQAWIESGKTWAEWKAWLAEVHKQMEEWYSKYSKT